MKKKILVFITIFCVLFTATIVAVPLVSQCVNAESAGSATALIKEGRKYKGKTLYQTHRAMVKNHGAGTGWRNKDNEYGVYAGQWCAWFVSNCAKYTGLDKSITCGGAVYQVSEGTVNDKGGTITFVDEHYYNACKNNYKASRRTLNTGYKPRKGDLVLFYNDNPETWNPSHIGIVTADSSSKSTVSTIEGNTGANSIVDEYKKRADYHSGRISYKVAYVTPKYPNAVNQYTIKFVNDGKTVRTDTVKFKKTDKGYRGTFTAPVQSKTGYDFKGWTVKKKSGDKSYTACNVSSEKNGWKWVDSSKAKNLRYYPNGHSFTYALSTADVPTWGVNPGDTLTLTANWEKHKYKITYKSGVNDGSVSNMPSNGSTVPYGESLILRNLSKPVREGYEFAGWKSSANGDIYQSSVRIYKDTTFTAQWKKVVRVDSIDISGKDQLNAGDRTTYKVTITPAEAADKKVTWSVENGSGAATITSDGVMTAEEAGTVTVKAAADGKDASITVNILPARDGMISEKEYREKYEGNSDYQATPYYRYKTRSKDTVVSGKKSLSGYTLKGTKQVSKTTGGWTTSEPKTGTTEGSDYSTVVSAESKAAYYSYAYYCKDKKICWKTNTGSHKGCSKTNKLLQVYSSKSLSGSGYKKDTSDASYVCPKTFSTSSPGKLGTVYLVKYDGKSGAFTTAAKTGHIYLWQSSVKTKTIYRTTTTKVQYTHEKYTGWSEWSGWSDERESISDPNLKSEEVRYKVERVNSTDPEDYVSVPDVKGRSESEAKEILENAGLKVKIQYVKSEEEEGTVVSCSAEGKVLKGSMVVLEVATGFESGLVTKEEYESKYAGSDAYDAVPYYRYATRTKQTVTNGYKNYSGYTLEETKKVGTSYGAWSTSAPKTGTTDGSSYQTVVIKESKNAYYTYAYYCNCKKWSWKVTGGSHQGCSNTKNLLQVYSSKSLGSSGYKKDASDGSYTVTAKTLGVNAPGKLGTVYCMKYKGSAVNSFTTAAKTGQIYLWPSSSGTKTVYRPVTTKYQYIHSKWSEWSAWGEWTPEVKNTSDSLKKDTEIMYYVTKK